MTRSMLLTVARSLSCAALLLAGGGASYAQSLNPNPLLPSGVGSASDIDMSRGGGGGRLGRGVGPSGRIEANPADTLLRGINGTNNGRRTGRGEFADARRRNTGYRGGTLKIEEGAVRFDRRGAYEEAIYGSKRGSYTQLTRRRGRSG
ncbi:MAG TPA: hypothetical protein VNH11_19455 [Pirellulales bacterium]|nr:hypothetical protein [Pirellulales bacterium]